MHYLLVGLIFTSLLMAYRPSVSIGPMLGWEIGHWDRFHWGFELSYWEWTYPDNNILDIESSFSHASSGVDIGIEFFKKSTTLYGAYKLNPINLMGVSAGIVYDTKKGLGQQFSAWAYPTIFGHGMVRERYYEGSSDFYMIMAEKMPDFVIEKPPESFADAY